MDWSVSFNLCNGVRAMVLEQTGGLRNRPRLPLFCLVCVCRTPAEFELDVLTQMLIDPIQHQAFHTFMPWRELHTSLFDI